MRGIEAVCRGRLVWLWVVLAAGASWLVPTTSSAALTWSAPSFLNAAYVDSGLVDLACPISTQCVAVDSVGREVAFDPADPGAWSAYAIDGRHALTGVSCPAASRCVAVDGRGNEITFDPAEIGAAPQRYVIDPGRSLASVSCPSIDLCAAVDGAGRAVTFDPADASSMQVTVLGNPAPVLGNTALSSVACPSTVQCTALDSGSSGGWAPLQPERMITFDPQTDAIVSVSQLPGTVDITALACPTTGECVGAGSTVCAPAPADQPVTCGDSGATVTVDPTSSAIAPVTVRSPVHCTLGCPGGQARYLDVACVSALLCTAMDASGTEVTFDPNSSGVLEQAAVDPLGDWPKGFNGSRIACLPTGVCVLATTTYESAAITFEPLIPGKLSAVPIDAGAPIAALTCPELDDCIELANTKSQEQPPTIVVASLDSGFQSHISSAGSFLGTVGGFACPKRNRCTVVMTQKGFRSCGCSWSSAAATFNPGKPASRSSASGIRIDKARIVGLACPGVRECTAVDERGREVNFNPDHPAARSVHSESSKALSGIACSSAAQCTAVGKHGIEVTFVPTNGALITSQDIDGARKLTAIACPTARQCSAVDQLGREITFDPRRHGRLIRYQIGTAALTSISCPSQRLCIAVGVAGNAAVGDPLARRRWTVAAIPGASSLLAVACTSSHACVAADSTGHSFETAARTLLRLRRRSQG